MTMQITPEYKSVNNDVKQFLLSRIEKCKEVGISRERLIVDPGFGFGKTVDHNLELLENLRDLATLGCPILVGLSRKIHDKQNSKTRHYREFASDLGVSCDCFRERS